MSKHDDEVRLHHMLEHAREAVAFVVGKDRSDLDLADAFVGVGPIDRNRW